MLHKWMDKHAWVGWYCAVGGSVYFDAGSVRSLLQFWLADGRDRPSYDEKILPLKSLFICLCLQENPEFKVKTLEPKGEVSSSHDDFELNGILEISSLHQHIQQYHLIIYAQEGEPLFKSCHAMKWVRPQANESWGVVCLNSMSPSVSLCNFASAPRLTIHWTQTRTHTHAYSYSISRFSSPLATLQICIQAVSKHTICLTLTRFSYAHAEFQTHRGLLT